jgi:hypothetical protein
LAKAAVDEAGLDAIERRLGRADLRFIDNRGFTISVVMILVKVM